jgi:hypothetical protein
LTAAFGFLKATDHISDEITKDNLIFIEKNQVEVTGKDGRPLMGTTTEDYTDDELTAIINARASSNGVVTAKAGP